MASADMKKFINKVIEIFEIIIVDNESKDKTIKVAKEYKLKIVKIKKFLPGKAINLGIAKSKGDIIICLSAHCIPLDNFWIKNLIKDLSKKMLQLFMEDKFLFLTQHHLTKGIC